MGKDRNTEEFGRLGEDRRGTPGRPGREDVSLPGREGNAAGRHAAEATTAVEETERESGG
ncbi:hypothetical protein QMZ92_32545 [Streptomyces sp. HNM0645]|uniref:hypothetical protein n=1 Tax=Streptomyces sp. HNM0645 TaxID=2782343 RepID=UPI0024B826B9|nr:hypothetical protein [Streptomyces sp. HNM0645]MDI9888954.1 hypothetical protein [Streptomyces sp. HNM0645]